MRAIPFARSLVKKLPIKDETLPSAGNPIHGISPRWRLAIGLSLFLFAIRVSALRGLGWGDSEALYACYSIFPQPAYLDHPGMVGLWMRALGGGHLPTPGTVHLVTALMASLVPWVGVLAARAFGHIWHQAVLVVFALALVPELALGLSALTPDLPLALAWLGALAFAGHALRSSPSSRSALMGWMAAGVLVGLAFTAKVSGALLGLSLLVTLLLPHARAHLRTAGPVAGMALALFMASPVILWESGRGWPMLTHRLLETQPSAKTILVNLGKLFGGQCLYVGPVFLLGAFILLKDLYRHRKTTALTELTWAAVLVPGIPLTLLSLWAPRSEPHWIAPALLPLALRIPEAWTLLSRKVVVSAWVNGLLMVGLGWVWVRTPWPLQLLGDRYQARYDLANDLYAWQPAQELLRESVERSLLEAHRLPVVVGPHWIVCAQAQAALGPGIRVGCNSPNRDDFDGWLPRSEWMKAPVVLYITDDRFTVNPVGLLPHRKVTSVAKSDVRRGNKVVRTMRITRLELEEAEAKGSVP